MGDGPEKVRGGGGIVLGGGMASQTLEAGGEGRLDLPVSKKGTVSVMVGATFSGLLGGRQTQSQTTRTITPEEVSHYDARGLIKGNTTNNNGGTVTEGEKNQKPIASVFFHIQGTGRFPDSHWRMGGFWSPGVLVVDETSGKISGDVSFQQPTKAPCVDLPGQDRCKAINDTPEPTVAITQDPTTKRKALFTNHLGLVVEADAGDNVTFAARAGLQLLTDPGVRTEAGFGGFVVADFHTSGHPTPPLKVTITRTTTGALVAGRDQAIHFSVTSYGSSKLDWQLMDDMGGLVDRANPVEDLREGTVDITVPVGNTLPAGVYSVRFTLSTDDPDKPIEINGGRAKTFSTPFGILPVELTINGPSAINKNEVKEATYNVTSNSTGAGTWKVVDDKNIDVPDLSGSFEITDTATPAEIKVPTDKLEWGKSYRLVVTWTATGKEEEFGLSIGAKPTGATIPTQTDPNDPARIRHWVPPLPKDTDGDGVPDGKDKCLNTPKGRRVNRVGCPKI